MEKRMLKKKSYMDKSNLMNEGILDKIFDYIKKGKFRQLQKAFRKQPIIQKKINQINKDAQEITKQYRKEFGKDVPKDFFIK